MSEFGGPWSNKITQHALKMSESSPSWSWTLYERRKRSPHRELNLKNSRAIFLYDTPTPDVASLTGPGLVTKGWSVQKILPWQTLTEILNLFNDLNFEHRNPIFSQDTLAYNDVPSKFGGTRIGSSKDVKQTVIFQLHQPSLGDLDFEASKLFFSTPPAHLWQSDQWVMHHHTKFGN